ncbi:MAG: tRNA threonylcarbamoyladenosine dehydratase [Prevotella sp.]|nr:tRNA threonylcarbamoyladenosine dehydratase [Prevotella sp.]
MALQAIFRRAELLLGDEAMNCIGEKRVIIFGVGGVGSWCAESLVRSGIEHLTIVDSDRVCITNVNRQLMATSKTVGQVKVEALKERLLSINPQAEITALQQIFTAETADSFDIGSYDYIIDAIDSLKDKALLILMATQTQAKFFSSMGAALKLDPTRIKTAEFWKVQGDPLARALRKRFKALSKREKSDACISSSEHEEARPEVKRDGQYPKRKFLCVYSDELLENKGHNATCGTEQCMCPKAKIGPGDPTLLNHEWCSSKAQINGTLAHITAIFGFMLAGLVIQDIAHSF